MKVTISAGSDDSLVIDPTLFKSREALERFIKALSESANIIWPQKPKPEAEKSSLQPNRE